jgi:hypothetical protein
MLNINFDLFYELKQGSIVSNTIGKTTKYWRIVDGILETKVVINGDAMDDWFKADYFSFPVNGKFCIEERFERFNND